MHVQAGADRSDKVRIQLDNFFNRSKPTGSFRDIYTDITGDHRCSGLLRDCDRARLREAVGGRFAEAINQGTRDDYLRTVLLEIDRRADEQSAMLSAHFKQCALGEKDTSQRSAATVAKALEVITRPVPSPRESIFGMPLKINGAEGDALSSPMAYCMFREEIKRAVSEAIGRIEDWPFPDPVSLPGAMNRLSEIEAELIELRAEESALLKEASEFGADT